MIPKFDWRNARNLLSGKAILNKFISYLSCLFEILRMYSASAAIYWINVRENGQLNYLSVNLFNTIHMAPALYWPLAWNRFTNRCGLRQCMQLCTISSIVIDRYPEYAWLYPGYWLVRGISITGLLTARGCDGLLTLQSSRRHLISLCSNYKAWWR